MDRPLVSRVNRPTVRPSRQQLDLACGPRCRAVMQGCATLPPTWTDPRLAREQLKGKMEFRLGSEQRVCGQGDVVVVPGGTEHEAWFREDTEVIDFFAPPRDDFLLGGKP